MLVVWVSGFAQDTETIDFSSKGYSNAQKISKVLGENVTLTFTAKDGTAPTYYNIGTAIRMYDKNILNISSTKTIVGIYFELTQGNLKKSCFNSGTYNGTTNKWSGEATNIKITNNTGAQVRLKKLIITYKATSSNPTLTFSETEKTVYKGAESEFTMPTLVLKDKDGKEVTSGVEYLYEVTDANPEGCLDVDMTTGKVNFKKLGTANIKVTTSTANTGSELNNLTASFKLTYMKDPAAKDKLFFAEAEKTVYVGKTDGFDGLSATQYDVKGAEVTPDVITYEATPTGVVDIDGTTGKIKNWLKTGTVTIKATSMYSDEIYEASYVLNYKKIATTLTLSKTSVTVNLGETPELPTCTLKAGDEVLTKPLSYIISPDGIANINSSTGELTLISAGKATVCVSFDGDETYESSNVATYDLTVVDPNAAEVTFDFSKPADYGYKAPGSGSATNLEEGDKIQSGVITITNIKSGKTGPNTNKARFHNKKNEGITFRVYANGEITLSAQPGYTITKFVFASSQGGKLTVSPGTYDSNTKTWEGNAQSISLAIPSGADATFFQTMTVNYSKSAANPTLTLDEKAEDTGDVLLKTESGKAYDVTLARTLTANVWNTICLPFDVTAEQIADVLKSEGNVKEYGSEDVNKQTIYFKDATIMTAGTPYLIKPTEDAKELVFKGVTIKNVDAVDRKVGDKYNMCGVFGKYAMNTNGTELFLKTDGKFYVPAEGKETMKGFRAYFLVPKNTAAAALNLSFGDATGINGVAADAEKNVKVYNVNGQYVGTSLEALPKGLYIVGGKKVLK